MACSAGDKTRITINDQTLILENSNKNNCDKGIHLVVID